MARRTRCAVVALAVALVLGVAPAATALPVAPTFSTTPVCLGLGDVGLEVTADVDLTGHRLYVLYDTGTGTGATTRFFDGRTAVFEVPSTRIVNAWVYRPGESWDDSAQVAFVGGDIECLPPFSDVPRTEFFFVPVRWAYFSGIASGYPDGTFRRTAPMSRQATAAFLYRSAGEPAFDPPSTATFPDVPTTHPFFHEVEWLAASGLGRGYDDGTFRPAADVSRQAASAFLYRMLHEEDRPLVLPPRSFPDVPPSSPFHAAVVWTTGMCLSAGYADGTFRPTAPVSRQAMTAFLFRAADLGRC